VSTVDDVRLGIVGVGAMGSSYAQRVRDGAIKNMTLSAICDRNAERIATLADVPQFDEAEGMFRSGLIDAVVIATPHPSHRAIGIAALEAGLHTLVEKPLTVTAADSARLLAAHRDPGQVFAAMFNQRMDPRYVHLRTLIASGALGTLQRMSWLITDWFRTEAYYASGTWRGSWSGEGGGVLVNQCPHNLDLWQWLFGMPRRVRAFCHFGKYHDVEVEDEVTAYLEYDSGATGVFVTTTGEAPGVNRLEVVGDLATAIVEHDRMTIRRNAMSAREFSRTSDAHFDAPTFAVEKIQFPDHGPQHTGILQNFADAIVRGVNLVAPAAEGIESVRLANAMLESSLSETTVSLPMDEDAFERRMQSLVAGSRRSE
jgi:predicted dehydrogenase